MKVIDVQELGQSAVERAPGTHTESARQALLAAWGGGARCPVCGQQDVMAPCCVETGVTTARVVRLSVPMTAVLEDADLRLALDDCGHDWQHTRDLEHLVSPTMSARAPLAERLARFAPSVADVTEEHALYATTAGSEYDGFGTRELGRAHGVRLVAVQLEYMRWQTDRYASGGYPAREVTPGKLDCG
jgi:hypothetical protein